MYSSAAKPWPAAALALRESLEQTLGPRVRELLDEDDDAPLAMTGCLMNRYDEDDGFIPWHSDEVRAHGALQAGARRHACRGTQVL